MDFKSTYQKGVYKRDKKIAEGERCPLKERKKPKVFICSSISIAAGESQMIKGDKRKNVLGAIVILLVIDSRI